MATHVMLDLETLDSGSNAAVVSIGAVKFDPMGDELGETFYQVIDFESAMKFGRVNGKTLKWWLRQSKAARDAITIEEACQLDEALLGFNEWYGPDPTTPVWGNGATFDNVIMSNAYLATGIDKPWGYMADRCFRTLKSAILPPVNPPLRETVVHNALDDARHQALWLQKIVLLRQLVVG
jgi:hypothetical protein